MIEQWLARESRGVKPEDLRQFSERLAVDLHRNKEQRGAERIPKAELAQLANDWNIPLEVWQVSGRSLLNRDGEGNYKFAHRSIMEYLFVKRLIENDVSCSGAKLTDLMKAFLLEIKASGKPLPLEIHWQLLRSKPISGLKEDAVRTMLKGNDFFERRDNNAGNGVAHRYEPREYQGEKVMFDHATGLMWQQSGSSGSMAYDEAQNYLSGLNEKPFAGFDDWRLPTLEEAMSLMERKKENRDLYINLMFNSKQRWIWTADKESASSCWVVHFDDGYCDNQRVDYNHSVRLVR